MMNVIPETRSTHNIRYLCFYYQNCMFVQICRG